eukprot:m.279399 g.279399  ORF g.279399 m.279399 type:complete len:55 (-) comp15742_c1_seq1:355-519(-)
MGGSRRVRQENVERVGLMFGLGECNHLLTFSMYSFHLPVCCGLISPRHCLFYIT